MRRWADRRYWGQCFGVCLVFGCGGEDEPAQGPESSGATSSGGEQCPNVIMDGSFERGGPSSAWAEGSMNFETVFCDNQCVNEAFDAEAHDGHWWIWFGGTAFAENAFVQQTVPIVSGEATLSLYVRIVTTEMANGANTLSIIVDGTNNVFMLNDLDSTDYVDWQPVEIDLEEFADSSLHEISIDANFPGGTVTSFFVDTVELRSCVE